MKKLLNERKETTIAVPVPVPVLPGGHHIAGLPAESSFEGSYVAVAGRPGERTVHIVNGRTGVEIAGTGNMFWQYHRSQYIRHNDCVLTFPKNVPCINCFLKTGFSSGGKNAMVPFSLEDSM